MRHPSHAQDKATTNALIITALFAVLGIVGITHHEMWRDELQAWMIARDSVNITQLFQHLKYEGHPGLWHLLLMPLTRIFGVPEAMQWLHLSIASVTVFVLARFSPFTWPQKILISLGYFFFYEYAILSRNYGIGVLCIVIFCALFPRRDHKIISIAIVLALLAHTNILGLIIAIVLLGALIMDAYWHRQDQSAILRAQPWRFGAAIMLVMIAIVLAALQMNPPPDQASVVGWKLYLSRIDLQNLLQALVNTYLPLPKLGPNFWAYPPFPEPGIVQYALMIGFVGLILLTFTLSLLQRPLALLIFSGSMAGLLAFFYTKYLGSARHHGYLFICLIMSAWLAPYCPKISLPVALQKICHVSQQIFAKLFVILLAFQAVAGMTAAYSEYQYVFSNARATAQFLNTEQYSNAKLVGNVDFTVSAIAGYLPGRQILYPNGAREGTFIRWDKARKGVTMPQIILAAKEQAAQSQKAAILILSTPLEAQYAAQYHLDLLKSFTGAGVQDENYYLYRIEP